MYLCIYFSVCMCVCLCVCLCKKTEDKWEWVLLFYHVCPKDESQVAQVGDKCPDLLNYLEESFKEEFQVLNAVCHLVDGAPVTF